MPKATIFLWLLILLMTYAPSFCQVEDPITTNNEAFLKIIGTEQDYEFMSNNLGTRWDRDENQFEFFLPMASLFPVEDPQHLKILQSLFPPETSPTILLTAALEAETISIADFTKPMTLTLNGVLTLNGTHFNLPVELSIFSNGRELFYNMETRFNLDLLDTTYEGIYKELITGEFALYVNDASWESDFRGINLD